MDSDPSASAKGGVELDLFARRFPRIIVTLALLVAGCGPSEDAQQEGGAPAAPESGGTAVACVQAAPSSLNPLVTNDQRASDLAPLLFTSLVRWDSAGAIRPYLARSWAWEDDRRRLIFELREDLFWHDSTRVTARDVAWTLSVASRPAYGYPEASELSSLDEAVARDSFTVAVRFDAPYAAGLEPFASLPILPRQRLGDLSAEEFGSDSYHQEPVGSGPFRFVERRPNGSLVYDRSGQFPEELGPVYLDRIVVRVISAPRGIVTEFRTGGVDLCLTTSSAAGQLQEVEGLEIHPLRPPAVQFVALNTTIAPLGDTRVRRALSAALDRSAIAGIVSPLASAAGTPLPETSPWMAPALSQPDAAPSLADSLLTAAGWTREGEEAVRQNSEGEELTFTLMAPSQLRDPLTVVQSQLREVGVDVELRFMEWTAFVGTIRNPETRPAAMALGTSLQSLRRPDLRGMLHSESPTNLSGYGDPKLDSLLAITGTARDSQSLEQAYRGIQRLITEEAPVLFTIYVPRGLAVSPRVRGVEPTVNTPLASAAEWWIPSRRRQ